VLEGHRLTPPHADSTLRPGCRRASGLSHGDQRGPAHCSSPYAEALPASASSVSKRRGPEDGSHIVAHVHEGPSAVSSSSYGGATPFFVKLSTTQGCAVSHDGLPRPFWGGTGTAVDRCSSLVQRYVNGAHGGNVVR